MNHVWPVGDQRRRAAEASVQAWPALPISMRTTRTFMERAVRHLAEDYQVRQFLDIGTGIPKSPNVHEIAQAIVPDACVGYVDNDPIVLTHARALMSSTAVGRTCYVDADFRDPESIIANPRLREVLDFSQPVALSLIAIVHFVLDADDPQGIVRRFMDALAPGSHLALTVFTGDTDPIGVGGVSREYNARGIPLRSATSRRPRPSSRATTYSTPASHSSTTGGRTPTPRRSAMRTSRCTRESRSSVNSGARRRQTAVACPRRNDHRRNTRTAPTDGDEHGRDGTPPTPVRRIRPEGIPCCSVCWRTLLTRSAPAGFTSPTPAPRPRRPAGS